MKKLLFIGILTLLAGGQSGCAQVTGVLSGRVVDATDAGVSGATVTVKTVDTGATRTAITNESGSYRIVSVPVDSRKCAPKKPDSRRPCAWDQPGGGTRGSCQSAPGSRYGFRRNHRDGRNALVNNTTSAVSGVVDERQVKDLPLNGRSFDNLIDAESQAPSIYALKSRQHQHQQRQYVFSGWAAHWRKCGS